MLTSPFLGSKLEFVIESNHVDGDKGEQENAVGLSDEVLKVRKVQLLNIGTSTEQFFAVFSIPRAPERAILSLFSKR